MANKYALLIGNNVYDDPGLSRLAAPPLDVQALSAALIDPKIGRFDPQNVTPLTNAPRETVVTEIQRHFEGKQKNDLLLLYFSGHGVVDAYRRFYFAVNGTHLDRLPATAVSARDVNEFMDHSASKRQLVILDCCHAGAFPKGTRTSPGGQALDETTFEVKGYGREILTATDATSYAFDGNELVGDTGDLKLGVFTRHLVDGLTTGEAAPESDEIRAEALFKYAKPLVEDENPLMKPRRWIEEGAQSLVIARNPNPPGPKPAALPIGIEEQLKSSNYMDRMGGVQELKRLALGEDRPLALMAREQLPIWRGKEHDIRVLAVYEESIAALTAPAEVAVDGSALLEETAQLQARNEELETEIAQLKPQVASLASTAEPSPETAARTTDVEQLRARNAELESTVEKLEAHVASTNWKRLVTPRTAISGFAGAAIGALAVWAGVAPSSPDKALVVNLKNEIEGVERQLAERDDTIEILRARSTKLQSELEGRETTIDDLKADIANLSEQVSALDELKSEIATVKQQLAHADATKRSTQAALETARVEAKDLREQLSRLIGPATVTTGDSFQDCPKCPEMVSIPAGTFTMGSPEDEEDRDEDEGPQRKVTVKAFSIGKHEITFDEWDACVATGDCSHKPGDVGWGRGRRPVISVSWVDAQEYVSWLSAKTGKRYRLPSEAEWEYAARAGTTSAYWWGD